MQARRTAIDPAGLPFWANVTITACFENLPEANRAGYLHEAWYIISIAPISGIEKGKIRERIAPKERRNQAARSAFQDSLAGASEPPKSTRPPLQCPLSESILHNFDFPMCALTSDGSNFVRNRAMDGLLGVISSSYEGLGAKECADDCTSRDSDSDGITDHSSSQDSERTTAPHRPEVEASWLLSHFKVYDPSFTNPMPESEYPLFKAAVLGQRFKHLIIGVISADGTRRVLECEGWPVYDAEGHGNFIGGMLILEDVTRQRTSYQAEQEMQFDYNTPYNRTLANSEHYWQHLCQEFPEISWVANGQGYFEWYNKQWYTYTGATEKQSLGAGWTSYVHHEDLPAASKTWSRALRTSSRYEIQERVRAADGTYRWMLCRAHPHRDASGTIVKWFGTLTDIHTTLLTLSANREARENLSDAVAVADITLWSVNMQGQFTLAEGTLSGAKNQSYTASVSGSTTSSSEDQRESMGRLNPSLGPIIGKSIFEEWGPSTRSPVERAMAGESVTEEVSIRGRTYRTHYRPRRARMSAPTSFLLSQDDEEAQIIGVTGISFDISERMELERKMAESIREVSKAEAATAAAKEASRMKSQFLAVISHEIRTPLNGVVGLSELLLDIEELPVEAQDLVHAILRSSGALLSVINDVLDFSKVEAGKLDLVSLPFSIDLVCQDAVRDFKKLMGNKGLTLAHDIHIAQDGLVLGDAGRITQVLNNLLSNASKFTDNGLVKFSARSARVGELGANYTFTVSDTGCGIPKHQHSLLFQPFRQADPSTSRRYGGSGLGLAICKNLIELMGGQISLQSEEGRGTTVTFTVPLPHAGPAPLPLTESLEARDTFVSTPSLDQTPLTDDGLGQDLTTPEDELPYIEPVAIVKRQSGELGFRRSSVVSIMPDASMPTLERKPRTSLPDTGPLSCESVIKQLSKFGYGLKPAPASASASTTSTSAPEQQPLAESVDPMSKTNLPASPPKSSTPTSQGRGALRRSPPFAGSPLASPPPSSTKLRILLAEDNPVNAQIAIKTLHKLGYDVHHVEDGQQALDAFEAEGQAPYDLCLMDCMMPVVCGLTATRRMRQSKNPKVRGLPVIGLTALALQGDREEAFAAGMDDYLTKPYRRGELQTVLNKWIGRERRASNALVPLDVKVMQGLTDPLVPVAGNVDLTTEDAIPAVADASVPPVPAM